MKTKKREENALGQSAWHVSRILSAFITVDTCGKVTVAQNGTSIHTRQNS